MLNNTSVPLYLPSGRLNTSITKNKQEKHNEKTMIENIISYDFERCRRLVWTKPTIYRAISVPIIQI